MLTKARELGLRKRLSRFSLALCGSLVAFFVLSILLRPIVVDTHHFDDMVFLLDLGWRASHGLVAGRDFEHLYPGGVAEILGLSFRLFGPSARSIDIGFVMLFMIASGLAILMQVGRVPVWAIHLSVLVSAAIVISGMPIELPLAWFHSTHSFVYNHIAVVLYLGLAPFVLLSVRRPGVEIAGAIACGAAIAFISLLKVMFLAAVPVLLLVLLVRGRWRALVIVVSVSTLVLLSFGSPVERLFSAYEVTVGIVSSDQSLGGVSGRLRVGFLLFSATLTYLIVLGVVGWGPLARAGWSGVSALGLLFLIFANYLGMSLLMGGGVGLKWVPGVFFASICLAEIIGRLPESRARGQSALSRSAILWALAVGSAFMLVLPGLAVSAKTHLTAWKLRGLMLADTGLLSQYWVKGSVTDHLDGASSGPARLDQAIMRANEDLRSGLTSDAHEYVVFADGLALLESLDGLSQLSVVSNGRMFGFSMPSGSRPLRGYPTWVTPGLNWFAKNPAGLTEVDVVMIANPLAGFGLVTEELQGLMGDDFVVAGESVFWTMYRRRTP